MNINDFIPTMCEPNLKKIYKDFPGWQKKYFPIEHIHIVDFYGNPVTITRHPNINTNYFDGFGVIRNMVDKDGDYPFLTVDPVEFMTKVCAASNATKTAKSTWINEKKLNEAIKWTFNIGGMRHKYSKYIDIILGK